MGLRKPWIGIALLGAVLSEAPALAIEAQRPAVAPRAPAALPTQADLSVNAIHAKQCKCDISDVDALYMGDIRVDVAKRDISTPAAARTQAGVVVGYLKVTYHDLAAGRPVTHNLMVQNENMGKTVRVVDRPVLVKKSVGIKAELRLNSPGYAGTDPVPSNNVMIKTDCQVLIY